MEPIVSRSIIRDLARDAHALGLPMRESNPFAEAMAAHAQFEHDYLALELEEAAEVDG